MLYKVLQATIEKPTKNDFVKTCNNYLKDLHIDLGFEEIGKMSKWCIQKLVKEKTMEAALKYLKIIQSKQTKIMHLKYDDLKIQEYLLDGNQNTNVSKFIFKARSMTLNIKTQKSWKYQDKICVGCGVQNETGDEILISDGLSDGTINQKTQQNSYDMLYSGNIGDMIDVAKTLIKRLKVRDKLQNEKAEETSLG